MRPMQRFLNMLGSVPVSGCDVVTVFAAANLPPQSAGAAIARAVEYGHAKIVGTTKVNGKDYNLYQ